MKKIGDLAVLSSLKTVFQDKPVWHPTSLFTGQKSLAKFHTERNRY